MLVASSKFTSVTATKCTFRKNLSLCVALPPSILKTEDRFPQQRPRNDSEALALNKEDRMSYSVPAASKFFTTD